MRSISSKIDAITHIAPEYRAPFIPIPRSVKIELTARCNYACSFCASSQKLREKGEMDYDFFGRITSEMREAGVEELGLFFLGESFMVPWLPKAVYWAKKTLKYPYVFLTTNGSLATPDKVRKCMANGLDSLKWSFNYANAEQMSEIAGVKEAYFYRVIEHIRSAYEIRETDGWACGLYASYIQYDGAQGERMAKAIEEIRPFVDEIYALPLYNQAGFATESEKGKGWKAIPGNIGRAENPVPPLPCWAVLTEGHITWDAMLGACCFSHDSRFDMADLTKTPFKEAWNSLKFQELRKAHLNEDVTGTVCERCVIYE